MAVARHCIASCYAGAAFAYAAGSIMRGEGTVFSDIDLVVVFPSLQRAWREVATGCIVGSDIDSAHVIQAKAESMLAAGPKPLAGADYDMLRYQVTDLADDLRGGRPPEEVAAIAALLYQKLASLILLGRGAWTGRGKWAPRLMKKLDAQLAAEFDAAFKLAAAGDGARFLALADRELALHGGRYFEGFRQDAPLEARRLGSIDLR
nr:nucleotidyltransferase domain-containing protein [Rhizobium leguminosarum]